MRRRDFIRTASGLLVPVAAMRGQILQPIISGGAPPTIKLQTNSGPSKVHPFQNGLYITKTGAMPIVNWGDGSANGVLINNANVAAHTYSADGTKVITLSTPDSWDGVTVFKLNGPSGANSQFTNGAPGTPDANFSLPSFAVMKNLTRFESCDTWLQGAPPDFRLLQKLQYLDLQGNFFSGPIYLSGLTELTYLDIHYPCAAATNFGAFPDISASVNLQTLKINQARFSSGAFSSIGACTKLVDLQWGGGPRAAMGTWPDLSACTLLQTFNGEGPGDNTGFSGVLWNCAPLTALRSFKTYGSNVTGAPAGSFATQQKLSSLDLSYGTMPAAAVNQILADCVASLAISGRVTCNLKLNLHTNAAPTGQGLTDVDTLRAAGWTVTKTA